MFMAEVNELMADNQNPKAVLRLYTDVKQLLTSGEEIEYIAVQDIINPDCLVLTNKRIIFYRVKNFGLTREFTDFIWKDVKDCHIKEKLLGTEFTVVDINERTDVIEFLPNVQARKIYRIAQEKEEEQREVRRQREMEEKRAGASNILVGTQTSAKVEEREAKPDDPLETLRKLKSLLDNELITQQEYDAKKAEILARL
jgi:hypothetical protein